MIFQAIDDKRECVGVYCDGKLHFENFPSTLTRTWRYSASMPDPSIEYAWLWCGGCSLEQACPDELKAELVAAQRKFRAFVKSFELAKVSMNDHCIFDLVPHDFLLQFCEIRNKVTQHIFDTYEKPQNYDHLNDIQKLIHKIKHQKLNLNLDGCKNLMYSTRNRRHLGELMKGFTHVQYNLFGTVTGRLTTDKKSFPILTVARKNRTLVKPHNDFLLSLDYNGAEIRTFLDLANQQQPEGDIHQWNIENIFDEGLTRDEAKTIFFAWLYNPESKEIKSEMYNREKILDKYYKEGYIITPYKRRIKVDERRALNYLIQSTNADRVLSKAVILDKMLEGRRSFVSHMVHDEIVIDYSDEDRELVAEIKNTFEDGYMANVKAGKDYYNLKELSI